MVLVSSGQKKKLNSTCAYGLENFSFHLQHYGEQYENQRTNAKKVSLDS